MPEPQIESSPTIMDWGVPDWRDAEAYPDPTSDPPRTLPLVLWQWEFLRRSDEYRQDWLKYAPETYQKRKAEYEANPVEQWIMGYRQSTGEPVIEEYPKVLLPVSDLNFCAEMPGSEEKYGLASLHHPANPRPQLLAFGSGDIRGVKWDIGRGDGPSTYWGLEYTVYSHELSLCFDLSSRPVEALMASLNRKFPLSPESGDALCKKKKATLLDKVRWGIDGVPAPPKDKYRDSLPPRFIRDPQQPEMVHVIWDTGKPAGRQQQSITALLTRLQDALHEKPQARRARSVAWPNYLRVLDARAINPETKKPYATYEEIGYTVFGSQGYNAANGQAGTAYNDALRLTFDFPTYDPKYYFDKTFREITGIVNLTIEGRNEAASHNPLCAHRVLPNLKRLSTQNPIVDRL